MYWFSLKLACEKAPEELLGRQDYAYCEWIAWNIWGNCRESVALTLKRFNFFDLLINKGAIEKNHTSEQQPNEQFKSPIPECFVEEETLCANSSLLA